MPPAPRYSHGHRPPGDLDHQIADSAAADRDGEEEEEEEDMMMQEFSVNVEFFELKPGTPYPKIVVTLEFTLVPTDDPMIGKVSVKTPSAKFPVLIDQLGPDRVRALIKREKRRRQDVLKMVE
ncbi:hypothetical protein KIPB_003580 [Kipferlia bialata]|uniref:Uncharacterized protein n=1 Tax=Kipferlia bialata TaxID=797122 RepID=A0A9K3CSL9_9EUKA|nr:hypothetical protein KIPB_003580 [Kipferlia bialata]|eukprot:g3580.t1